MKSGKPALPALRSVKVLDQLRERVRYLHYSLRTEEANVHWVRAFIRFHGVRHPASMGAPAVEQFLSWLAVERGMRFIAATGTPAPGNLGTLSGGTRLPQIGQEQAFDESLISRRSLD